MSEKVKQPKKKVYVETTVISDATALPSKDLVLAGRQFVSREWLDSAKVKYELYSSFLVRRESLKGDPDAAHIATAAINEMDYLVSWNFRHITNAQTIPLVKRICETNGYRCPEICTPQMLQGGDEP